MLPKYVQTDPNRPPVSLLENDEFYLYEEEKALVEEAARTGMPWTGILKPLFRFMGWGKKEEPVQPEKSKKVARTKRSGGLFEK